MVQDEILELLIPNLTVIRFTFVEHIFDYTFLGLFILSS